MTIQGLDTLPRDRWGRPLLRLPNDPPEAPRSPFTRASTLSKAIENTFNLEQWQQRLIVQGFARRPELLSRAVAAHDDKKKIEAVIAEAFEEMERDKAADLGTQIHALTVNVDAGIPIPEGQAPHVTRALDHYRKAMRGWQVMAGEQFVANQQIRTAGTFDRVVRHIQSGEMYVGDIKTGMNAPAYAHSAQVQLAVYAHGTRYFYPGDTWEPRSLADKGVSQEKALLIHLPQDGSGCQLFWLDIRQGWQYAILASKVRSWWNVKIANPIRIVGSN